MTIPMWKQEHALHSRGRLVIVARMHVTMQPLPKSRGCNNICCGGAPGTSDAHQGLRIECDAGGIIMR